MSAYIFLYPMHVLSTNRILKTSITKQSDFSKINIFRELGELASKGLPGMWRGFVPFCVSQFMHLLPLGFGAAASSIGTPYGLGALAFGTLLANPFEIASVRYQNVEYSRGNILGDIAVMYSNERRALFTTGYLHVYFRNVLMMLALTNMSEVEEGFLAQILAMTALSQPFEVLRVRQQWAFHDRESLCKAVGESPVEAGYKILKEEGISGLFRGFVPRAGFLIAAGYMIKATAKFHEK